MLPNDVYLLIIDPKMDLRSNVFVEENDQPESLIIVPIVSEIFGTMIIIYTLIMLPYLFLINILLSKLPDSLLIFLVK